MKNRAQASGRNDSVSAALTAPKAKPVETRDTGRDAVRGLLLRVQPPPSKVKAYYLQLGRGKRVYIGDAHTTTLKRARELWRPVPEERIDYWPGLPPDEVGPEGGAPEADVAGGGE